MIVTTTPNVEGKQIVEYKQVVFGEVIAGANFMRDFLLHHRCDWWAFECL